MLLFRFINIKVFILICLYIIPIQAQSSIDFLYSTCNKIYTGLSFYKSVSYNIKITTSEANNIISTYTAKVTEIYNNDANYAIYQLNNKQIFFSYSNILGIQRFWLGRAEDLPEIYSKDIDNKILNSAISYTNLNINPLWLNIPVKYKYDQGFLVIQTYSKNLFTNFPKIEIYINKENIPIRTLYYNKISNFPVLEVIVTDYRKEGNGYFLYKIEYKDNSKKKLTIIEKSEVKFDVSLPDWFEELEALINNNTTNYYNYFMMGIRDKNNITDLDEYFNKFSCTEDNKIIEPQENVSNKAPNANISDSELNLPYVKNDKKNFNNILLHELDTLNKDPMLSQDKILDNKKSIGDSNNKKKASTKIKEKTKRLDTSKNTKIINKDQKNLANKEKNLANKNSINEEPKIKNKVISSKTSESSPSTIKDDTNIKNEDTLKLDTPKEKIAPKNNESYNNDNLNDVPLKKEKKKNTLNNLF